MSRAWPDNYRRILHPAQMRWGDQVAEWLYHDGTQIAALESAEDTIDALREWRGDVAIGLYGDAATADDVEALYEVLSAVFVEARA